MRILGGPRHNSAKSLPPPKELFAQYPMGIRYLLFLHWIGWVTGQGGPWFDKTPYYQEQGRIENILVERNGKGIQLEKAGRLDAAIKLYEQNVVDCADTPHPYDRLRVIYTQRKQYDDAIRVCKAYIQLEKQLAEATKKEMGAKEWDPTRLALKVAGFTRWAEKLEDMRKAKAGS